MFVILRFIVGGKSTAKSSIIFGRRKIDNPSIHGTWTKPISKSYWEYQPKIIEIQRGCILF